MNSESKIIRNLNFQEIAGLDKSKGCVKANVAVWIKFDKPTQAQQSRLFLRYFAGLGYKTIELDKLLSPIQESALLSAQAKIPLELQNVNFELCIDVNGSSFNVDTLFVEPIVRKTETKSRQIWAA